MTNKDSSQNESDIICPQPIVIPTDKPEDEVWHHMGQLTSMSYVHSLLKYRLDNDFFKKLWLNIEALNKRKQEYNDSQDNENKHADMYEPLSSDNNIEHNVAEITLLTRQGIELYKASQVVNIYAKPFFVVLFIPQTGKSIISQYLQIGRSKKRTRLEAGR